jgi:hypothetical protein
MMVMPKGFTCNINLNNIKEYLMAENPIFFPMGKDLAASVLHAGQLVDHVPSCSA